MNKQLSTEGALEMKREWHSGPPPHVGWWNASIMRAPFAWRWWDGTQWSMATTPIFSVEKAAKAAITPLPAQSCYNVEWNHSWPEGARVPRIDPRVNKGK